MRVIASEIEGMGTAMRIGWQATLTTFDIDADSLICGIRGPGDRTYLVLSRVSEDADPTDDWGVYIEYEDQINSGYDLIGRYRLTGNSLTIDLVGPLGAMDEVEGFDVELDIDEPSLDRFRAGLRRIFRDRDDVLAQI